MQQVTIEAAGDFISSLAGSSPIKAVAELVWNAFDADATEVDIRIDRSLLSSHVQAVTVSDNGRGITPAEARSGFGMLGGSWKRQKTKTPTGRSIHGKEGKGRLRAFAIGEDVVWKTITRNGAGLIEFDIRRSKTDVRKFDIGDARSTAAESTGTVVTIGSTRPNVGALLRDSAREELLELFALHLRQYPDVTIRYDGSALRAADLVNLAKDYAFEPVWIEAVSAWVTDAKLTVVEWKSNQNRALHLCDADGFSLLQVPAFIHSHGIPFTAYLSSTYIRSLEQKNLIELGVANPVIEPLVAVAKKQLRDHIRARRAEQTVDVVEAWKRENVYPYEGAPKDVIEEVERQVFDVVAVNINEYHTAFTEADQKSKRFSLSLLKQALRDNPAALERIFKDVLELPPSRQNELARLLEKTSLSAIIAASNVVANRLDFLKALECLVYDRVSKEDDA